jgi:hypothetical protein
MAELRDVKGVVQKEIAQTENERRDDQSDDDARTLADRSKREEGRQWHG